MFGVGAGAKEPQATPAQGEVGDVELFQRFFAGNDLALVALFDRHNHRLFHYCLQLVGSTQMAEDVTQELWERLIRIRRDGREYIPRSAMGLLLTMARNLCIDALRAKRLHADLDELPEASHPQASIHEVSHLEELVIKALPHLPEAQREVLVLHTYSRYKFEEIADMLGEPVGAVRTRAWRARAHLGRIIAAMIGIENDRSTVENPSSRQHDQRGEEG